MSPVRFVFVSSVIVYSIIDLTACSSEQGEPVDGLSTHNTAPLAEWQDGGEEAEAGAPAEGMLVGTAAGTTDTTGSVPSACPQDMVEVKGEFCPSVLQECLRWLDKDHTNRFGRVDPNMCAEFRYPSKCVSTERVSMHFCVDRYEWPNQKGEIPQTQMSWVQAKSECEGVGKRLCADDEWTFACEGPDMKPYPYGDGYHRDSDACNADHTRWIDPMTNPFEVLDHRAPSGAYERCHSDWGVYDIVGNTDEWVLNTRGNTHRQPWISGLMGGHWVHGVRNRCRAITDSHEPMFSFYVTGARCCSDPKPRER